MIYPAVVTPSPSPIRFFHRGAVVEVRDAATTRSVLDWLREDAHCTGTKEGCNEGDCGACTVVIGETAAIGNASALRGLKLRAVNACLQFLPTLDGKALFTVEDLKSMNPRRALHPVQAAMVACHASQCGFCTPGFVMTLWSVYEQHRARVGNLGDGSGRVADDSSAHGDSTVDRSSDCARPSQSATDSDRITPPSRQQIADALSGNLCRCTGYRPILDAAQRMFELPEVALDTGPVLAALRELQRDAPFHYAPAASPHSSGDPASESSGALSGASPNRLSNGSPNGSSKVRPAASVDRFFAPDTLAAFAALREQHPKAQLLAGSTDIGLWVTKQFRPLGDILYLGNVHELKRIAEQPAGGRQVIDAAAGTELYIGAGASLEAAWSTLAQRIPALTDIWLRFASPLIRNAGTLGGNVANGSPIGDAAPVLMALDAQVELRCGARLRRLPLDAFYVGYLANRLEPGEFIQGVVLPSAALLPSRRVRAYKIAKRFDSDISALCGGFAIELDDAGTVTTVRLAYGGMAATVKRAAAAEAALIGRPWDQAAVDTAKAALPHDFQPLSDLRASAPYRLRVAQNLLQRFWLETRVDDPLPAASTSVFSPLRHSGSGDTCVQRNAAAAAHTNSNSNSNTNTDADAGTHADSHADSQAVMGAAASPASNAALVPPRAG